MVKNIAGIVDLVIITKHCVNERAGDPQIIKKEFQRYQIPVIISRDVPAAIKKALGKAVEQDLILITGSVFTVGEARDFCYNSKKFNRRLILRDY